MLLLLLRNHHAPAEFGSCYSGAFSLDVYSSKNKEGASPRACELHLYASQGRDAQARAGAQPPGDARAHRGWAARRPDAHARAAQVDGRAALALGDALEKLKGGGLRGVDAALIAEAQAAQQQRQQQALQQARAAAACAA